MLLVHLLMPQISWFVSVYIFFVGAVIGSFLNVVASRVPKNQSLLGRSHCGSCKHTLSWLDLFPIFSYLFLRGRCRYCHKKIGLVHPIFEIISGTVVLAWYFKAGIFISLSQIIILAIMLMALTLALADYYYQIIPDEFLLIMLGLAFLWHKVMIVDFLGGALLGALGFYALYAFSRGRAMGYGDVKYAFVMGLILPLFSLGFAIYLAFLTGGIVSAILILSKKKKMKSTISFGPFLSLGLVVSLWLII